MSASVRFLSVCSGIEAASMAWRDLGWTAVGFAEIDKAASRLLARRFGSNLPGEPFPSNGVPNHGDFTQIDVASLPARIDVLCGGTPCQAFSVAGKRGSLADARGNLTLAFVELAHELARSHGLRNAFWENVPGVLSLGDNAFGCFLGALVGHDSAIPKPRGRAWPDAGMVDGPRARAAWRVLDAQYFGLAQRRRRVFVVADFGGGADPAEILFERQGVRGNPPPRREARQGASADAQGGAGIGFGGGRTSGPVEQAACLTSHGQRLDFEVETFVAHALRGEGFDASEDGTGRGTPLVPVQMPPDVAGTLKACGGKSGLPNGAEEADRLVPVAFRTSPNCGAWETGDRTDALTTTTDPAAHMLCFSSKDHGADAADDLAPTMRAMGHADSHANAGGQLAVAFAIQERAICENPNAGPDGAGVKADLAYTIEARETPQAVAYDLRGREGGAQFEGPHDTANMRAASGGSSRSYAGGENTAAQDVFGLRATSKCEGNVREALHAGEAGRNTSSDRGGIGHGEGGNRGWAVRRLTPRLRECEALQGFPRGYTAGQADSSRYKQLGNSWAVPVVRWIGERMDAALKRRTAA